MKNAKNNNANLYSNFSPGFFKSYFLTGGAMPPPLELPMVQPILMATSIERQPLLKSQFQLRIYTLLPAE